MMNPSCLRGYLIASNWLPTLPQEFTFTNFEFRISPSLLIKAALFQERFQKTLSATLLPGLRAI